MERGKGTDGRSICNVRESISLLVIIKVRSSDEYLI